MHDRATTVGLCSITRPIQGQGHEALKVGNPSIFKSYFLRHLQWELATDHSFLLNLIGPDFWYSSYTSFCAAWLWPWQKRQLWRVDRQSGANFYSIPVYFHLDWQSGAAEPRDPGGQLTPHFFRCGVHIWMWTPHFCEDQLVHECCWQHM